jgi:hypothetical protein
MQACSIACQHFVEALTPQTKRCLQAENIIVGQDFELVDPDLLV